jgi:hypothetical protein
MYIVTHLQCKLQLCLKIILYRTVPCSNETKYFAILSSHGEFLALNLRTDFTVDWGNYM